MIPESPAVCKTQLKARLEERDIIVDEFNIVNFRFSKVFNEAIEAKVTAEQSALTAKNKLEQIKFEAEQRVAEAKGKAEAITVESNALRSNPQILELRALAAACDASLRLLNAHQFDAVERALFPSLEHNNVSLHCFDASIMGPDLGNGAIHTNERRGYSR